MDWQRRRKAAQKESGPAFASERQSGYCAKVNKPGLFGAHRWMLSVTALFFGLVAAFVDLKPAVDENFFFSTGDPEFRQTKKIEKQFSPQTQVIFCHCLVR